MNPAGPAGTTKSVRDPDFISLLLATRGRPQLLARLFKSIADTAAAPERLDVWLYVDADDAATRDYLAGEPVQQLPFAVHAVAGPARPTNGAMYNALRQANTSGGGLSMFLSDKITFQTPGWDAATRACFAAVPDRVLFAYFRDPLHRGAFGAFGVLSEAWMNATGRLMTEHFPFWYDDTWINDVASLIGRRVLIDAEVELAFGRTLRMQNLGFWQRFYRATLPERLAEAEQLRLVLGGELLASEVARLEAQYTLTAAEQQDVIGTERNTSGSLGAPAPRTPVGSPYRLAEDAAVAHLLQTLIPLGNDGAVAAQAAVLEAIAHSSRAADELQARVRAVLKDEQAGPGHPLVQRLFARFPNMPETTLLGVEACLNVQQPAQALALLETACQVFTLEPNLRKRLGVLRYEAGDVVAARAAFEAVLETFPDDLDALLSAGQLAQAAGDAAGALRLLGLAVERHPLDVDAREALRELMGSARQQH